MSKKEQSSGVLPWMIPNTPCWYKREDYKQDSGEEKMYVKGSISLVFQKENLVEVKLQNSEKKKLKPVTLYQANEEGKEGKNGENDMVNMPVLNEPEILDNIGKRYFVDNIFTYIGPTLIVMNPYKRVDKLFTPQQIKELQTLVRKNPIFELSQADPHVYSIAALAFYNLFKNMKKQAIVISGQSGAGKTENAKYAMKFLTSLSSDMDQAHHNHNQHGHTPTPVEQASIQDRILSCNPLLEAFGNAKTVRNDNSSRFGQYVSILVQKGTQRITGAFITKYLLEKSRVTYVAKQERCYHIFYQLLIGGQPGLLKELFLLEDSAKGVDFKRFSYLNNTDCFRLDKINDAELFAEVRQSMKTMNFTNDQQLSMWRLLASILLIGNITFNDKTLTDTNPCQISDPTLRDKICKLLSCSGKDFEQSITMKQREVMKQVILSPLTLQECEANRDSLAKGLYDALFTWLVSKLNLSILPPNPEHHFAHDLSIGLLDIFGFENFKVNSFEQLCINYTNEHLQQLYISYVFKNEEKVFIDDGLEKYLGNLQYDDNQPVLDLYEKQTGLFSLLDESCMLAKNTDEILLQQIIQTHEKNPLIEIPQLIKDFFTIVHTQSQVTYTIGGFRAKNQDEISAELQSTITNSTNSVIVDIFNTFNQADDSLATDQREKSMSSSSKSSQYLGAKFRNQMKQLMDELRSCDVNFIRCIKPNEVKRENYFYSPYVLQQIRYLGVLESIEVRKATYPARKTYEAFFDQYRACTNESYSIGRSQDLLQAQRDIIQQVKKLLKRVFPSSTDKDVLFGRTKVYMKLDFEQKLDARLFSIVKEKMEFACTKLKAIFKGKKQRKRYLMIRAATQKIGEKLLNYVVNFNQHNFSLVGAYAMRRRKMMDIKQGLEKGNKLYLKKVKAIYKHYLGQYARKNKEIKEEKERLRKMSEKQRQEELARLELQQKREQQRLRLQELNQKKQGEKNKGLVDANQYDTELYGTVPVNYDEQGQDEIETNPTERGLLEEHKNGAKPKPDFSNAENFKSIASKIEVDLLEQDLEVGKLEAPYQQLPLLIKILDQQKQSSDLNSREASSSDDCQFDPDTGIEPDMIKAIQQFKYLQFFEKHLRKRTTFFGGKKTTEQIMTSQLKPIKGGSLLLLGKNEDREATQVFTSIVGISNITSEPDKVIKIIKDIVEKAYGFTERFRNELLTQMLKQLGGNHNQIYMHKILQLMSVITYIYKPQQEFIMAALHKLYQIYKEEMASTAGEVAGDSDLKLLLKYMIKRMIIAYTTETQGKQIIPPNYQIMALMWMKQVYIPVFFPTGSHVLICVDHNDTIDDLKTRMLKKVQVDTDRVPPLYFGFFEVVNKLSDVNEKLLKGTQLVWDLLSMWEVERLICEKKGEHPPIYILMLKIRFCYHVEQNDLLSISVFFSQTFFDIYVGKFHIPEDELIKMAALLIIANGGISDINALMPSYYVVNDKQELKSQIQAEYRQINSYNVFQAQFEYLQIAQRYDTYMGVHIPVKYSTNDSPEGNMDAILVLKPMKLMLLTWITQQTFRTYTFAQVKRWGISHDRYMLIMTHDDISHMIETNMVEAIGWYLTTASGFYMKKIYESTNGFKQ